MNSHEPTKIYYVDLEQPNLTALAQQIEIFGNHRSGYFYPKANKDRIQINGKIFIENTPFDTVAKEIDTYNQSWLLWVFILLFTNFRRKRKLYYYHQAKQSLEKLLQFKTNEEKKPAAIPGDIIAAAKKSFSQFRWYCYFSLYWPWQNVPPLCASISAEPLPEEPFYNAPRFSGPATLPIESMPPKSKLQAACQQLLIDIQQKFITLLSIEQPFADLLTAVKTALKQLLLACHPDKAAGEKSVHRRFCLEKDQSTALFQEMHELVKSTLKALETLTGSDPIDDLRKITAEFIDSAKHKMLIPESEESLPYLHGMFSNFQETDATLEAIRQEIAKIQVEIEKRGQNIRRVKELNITIDQQEEKIKEQAEQSAKALREQAEQSAKKQNELQAQLHTQAEQSAKDQARLQMLEKQSEQSALDKATLQGEMQQMAIMIKSIQGSIAMSASKSSPSTGIAAINLFEKNPDQKQGESKDLSSETSSTQSNKI